MKAHYVPQFYLAGFVDPQHPPGYEPFLHVFTFARGGWDSAAPKKVARRPDYYGIVLPDGGIGQDLERALSRLEDVAASLIRGPLQRGATLTTLERVRLAEFVGAMVVRVPGAQDATGALMAAEGRQAMADLHAAASRDPGLLGRLREAVRARTGTGTGAEPEDELEEETDVADLDPAAYEIEATRNAVLLRTFGGLEVAVPHIAAMGWRVVTAPPGTAFVTSDAPVFLRGADGPLSGTLADVLRDDVELTLPLTRDVALLASPGLGGLEYATTSEATVHQVNVRTAQGADVLYASTRTLLGLDHILAARGMADAPSDDRPDE